MTYRLWPKWKLVVALGAMALWWGQGASTGTADETAGPVPSSNPLSGDPESIEVGRELYFTWCVQCHGPEADGVAPRWGKYASDLRKFWRGYTEFATIVVAGRPKKKMPPWDGVLDGEQVSQIGAYLETLAIEGAIWEDYE